MAKRKWTKNTNNDGQKLHRKQNIEQRIQR